MSFWKNDKNCHSLIIIVVIFNFSLSFLEISMEKSQTCPPHPQRRLVHSISGVWKGWKSMKPVKDGVMTSEAPHSILQLLRSSVGVQSCMRGHPIHRCPIGGSHQGTWDLPTVGAMERNGLAAFQRLVRPFMKQSWTILSIPPQNSKHQYRYNVCRLISKKKQISSQVFKVFSSYDDSDPIAVSGRS